MTCKNKQDKFRELLKIILENSYEKHYEKKRYNLNNSHINCCRNGIWSKIFICTKGGEVIIKVDGKDYGTYPLNEDKTIDIDEHNKVIIKEGVVYMEDANCPDKLCIKQGKIDSNGQKIVCLPNKTVVEISSEKRKRR